MRCANGEHFEILASSMQDLQTRTCREKCPQGLEVVDRKRIDERARVERGELHEAQLRIERALAHEFRIERDELRALERV